MFYRQIFASAMKSLSITLAVLCLAGCVTVPYDAPYDTSSGTYATAVTEGSYADGTVVYAPAAPVYVAPPPYYYAPPVFFGLGVFSGGHGHGHHRPGFAGRPPGGGAAPPALAPRPGHFGGYRVR